MSSQWPVVDSLPGPSGCRRPWTPGCAAGGTPSSGRIEPRPRLPSDRQVEAAGVLGEVRERVRALVAGVLDGVGQRPDAAGVEHDDEGAAVARLTGRILAQPLVARGCALK